MGRRGGAAWTDRESILWQTCSYVAALVEGREPAPPSEIMTTFVPQGGPADMLLAQGPHERLSFRALGDGTYTHDSGYFFATGPAGLAASAGVAVFRAAGNSNRRHAARAAAQQRWVVEDSGHVTVGTEGFHLATHEGVFYWTWGSITAASLVAPENLEMYGDSTVGPVHWILHTPWAELIFVLWALRRHRRHPQLVTGTWLPPGFLDHVADQGYRAPIPSPVLLLDR